MRQRTVAAIQAEWDDETRAARAVGYRWLSLGWSVPVVTEPILAGCDHDAVYDGYGATETIGRWRKSTAKTVHAAILCLQLELEQSEIR